MIRSIVKSQNGMVFVFNKKGRQLPEYQGQYENVRDKILQDAPPDALFWNDDGRRLNPVAKEEW